MAGTIKKKPTAYGAGGFFFLLIGAVAWLFIFLALPDDFQGNYLGYIFLAWMLSSFLWMIIGTFVDIGNGEQPSFN